MRACFVSWAHDHEHRRRRHGTGPRPAGRVNQKARTRAAIVRAVQDLARDGAEITMPSVARAALVSEATAYRYFPDLVSLLLEADAGVWPDPAESLAPVAASDDPVERVGYAAEVLFTGILARQSAVRAMIAASVTRPGDRGPAARAPVRVHRLRPRPAGRVRSGGAGPAQAGPGRGHERRGPVRPHRPVRAFPAGRCGERGPHRLLPHRERGRRRPLAHRGRGRGQIGRAARESVWQAALIDAPAGIGLLPDRPGAPVVHRSVNMP